MKIGHLNVRSLPAHFPAVRDLIVNGKYDIFAISETWIYTDSDVSAYSIDNYQVIFAGRTRISASDNRGGGGGVCLFIINNLNFKVLKREVTYVIEHLWVDVVCRDVRITVGVLYRPAGNVINFITEFEDTLSGLVPAAENFVCLGDFNIDGLGANGVYAARMVPTMEQFSLQQIISTATRVTQNSATLIDYIITDSDAPVLSAGVLPIHDVSDHSLVFVMLGFSQNATPRKKITYRDYRHFDVESFNADLSVVPWHELLYFGGIDEKLRFLNNCITQLFDIHAPTRTVTLRDNYRPWITNNVRRLMSLRDRAYDKFKLSRRSVDFNSYKELRNFTNASIKRERKAYLNQLFGGSNPRELWRSFRSLGVCRGRSGHIPEGIGDANSINDFFRSSQCAQAGDPELMRFYDMNVLPEIDHTLSFSLVSQDEIWNALRGIKTDAAGSDGISRRMLLLCCPTILPFLCHIFNFALEHSVFPRDWKNAVIVPLPKIPSPVEISDLRPISKLCALSKVFERLVVDRVWEHLNDFNILPPRQSGFRRGFSCASALLDVMDDVIGAVDRGDIVALILLDFSRAFDVLHHDTLLSILHYIGFSPGAAALVGSYLDRRTQQTLFGGSLSRRASVLSGVPQGSILGPVLYLVFTAYICSGLMSCSAHMYADDTQLYYAFNSGSLMEAEESINSDLSVLLDSVKRHRLVINSRKSSVVLFSGRRENSVIASSLNIRIGNDRLVVSGESRSLGVIIDSGLRFRKHVGILLRRAYSSLKLLYASRQFLDRAVRIHLCESLVLSVFNYADVVYDSCLDSVASAQIQRVQNACLRFIYGIGRREHISHTLDWASWLNMSRRRALHKACMYHRIILRATPPYLYNRIRFRTDVHNINIRHRHTLTIPQHRLQLFKRSFSYSVPSVFNNIPLDLRRAGERVFRREFKNLLMREQRGGR